MADSSAPFAGNLNAYIKTPEPVKSHYWCALITLRVEFVTTAGDHPTDPPLALRAGLRGGIKGHEESSTRGVTAIAIGRNDGVPAGGWLRPLWALPRRARPFVIAVNALYLGSLAVGVATTHPKMSDVLTFAVLVACAVLSIEGSLRLVWRGPKPGRTTNDNSLTAANWP